MKTVRLVVVSTLVAAALTACGQESQVAQSQGAPAMTPPSPAASSTPAPSILITVDPFSSAKPTTTVAVGATVKFASPSDEAKIQLAGDITSPMFGKEGWVTTFRQAGTFHYHSALNAGVSGTVVVR